MSPFGGRLVADVGDPVVDRPTDADDRDLAAVELVAVTKRFGDFTAVDAVDLEVVDGEFFSMLGPSGSG